MTINLFAPPENQSMQQSIQALPDNLTVLDSFANHINSLDISSIDIRELGLGSTPSWYTTLSSDLYSLKRNMSEWANVVRPGFIKQRWEIIIYSGFFELSSLAVEAAALHNPPSRLGVYFGSFGMEVVVARVNTNVQHLLGQFRTVHRASEQAIDSFGSVIDGMQSTEHDVESHIQSLNNEIGHLESQLRELRNQLGLGSQGGYTPAIVREIHHVEQLIASNRNRMSNIQYELSKVRHLRQQLLLVRSLDDAQLQNSIDQLADFWGTVYNAIQQEVSDIHDLVSDGDEQDWDNLRNDICLDLKIARQQWWSLVRLIES
ncbi:hypothetical protein ACSLBF_08015 [Pseudoalteromonas sp. T1lg65]|uniref:hypothetical protein n=1 Tax=Pseudoalteromonas sp. T1lg65 TaxID=2077101 RepID=UPI003F7A3EB2